MGTTAWCPPREAASWEAWTTAVVAAYRERWAIGPDDPLGAPPATAEATTHGHRARVAGLSTRRLAGAPASPQRAPDATLQVDLDLIDL